MVNSIFTNRRAVRNFSSESISDDEIKSLIAAFQTTPCGMHQTDVMSLVVVKDEALRDKIETKTDNACYHVPVLFIINTKKDSMFGERDASCGAENIMLEATDLDLGSVYVMGGRRSWGLILPFRRVSSCRLARLEKNRKQRIVQIVIKLQFIN